MLPLQTYAPRDLQYKTPYGAVPSGTAVTFTLRPPRREGWSCVMLTARYEFRDNFEVKLPLEWTDTHLGIDTFTATLEVGDYVGLIWYSFQLSDLNGKILDSGDYQLTVYDDAKKTPTWFGEGMSYQIFPDRFRRTHIPDATGMVGGRDVHWNWDDQPVWRPNHNGEVRNRGFFGGNLAGIEEKLNYLEELGVETLYLCPIFESAENHRYSTGDYEKVDPMLGTEADFTALCTAAKARGIHVMLDGVFNHQGYESKYFNGDGSYASTVPGAGQSKDSPYYDWYNFQHWPDKYDAWWGIYTLPATNESHPDYVNYIIHNKDSIIRRWLAAGADGWRLDVADELPDSFIHDLYAAAREEKENAVIIGEVWEDGTTKVAYGVRRRHLLGGHLDGLMNYPLQNAILDWLIWHNAAGFMETMETQRENYPPFAFYSSMNALGTHDTPRALTLLGVGDNKRGESKEWRAHYTLSDYERYRGISRLKLGLLVLFAFPGSPTVYYGDEAGMEGFEDPFNRAGYPWGKENQELLSWVKYLGHCRKTLAPLRRGDIQYVKAEGGLLAFTRTLDGQTILCAANATEEEQTLASLTLPPYTGGLYKQINNTWQQL